MAETTCAGDAFAGGFSVALSEGLSPEEAACFGPVTAGISVNREGTAPAMRSREEIDAPVRQVRAYPARPDPRTRTGPSQGRPRSPPGQWAARPRSAPETLHIALLGQEPRPDPLPFP